MKLNHKWLTLALSGVLTLSLLADAPELRIPARPPTVLAPGRIRARRSLPILMR